MFTEIAAPAKELESTAVVRFQDCDPFQHLNNSRYIDYFINAREDQLLQFYNFNMYDVMRDTKHGWVVSQTQVAYLSPALMQEQVIIRTRLIRLAENSIMIESVMLDQAAKRLKATSWIELTYVSLQTGRSARHPEDMMEFFRRVLVDTIFTAEEFTQRVDELKMQFRKPLSAEAGHSPSA